MRRRTDTRHPIAALVACCVATASALGQTGTVPVRPLGRIVVEARDTLRSVTSMRQLSDGRVFVEDGSGRRVLLFDSTLTRATVVIDSAGSTVRDFGPFSRTPLFAYAGDTTLFFDVGSQALVVLDPTGKVVRTMGLPVPADAALISGATTANGTARFDPQDRLVYRGMREGAGRPTLMPNGGFSFRGPSDTGSSPIMRVAPGTASPDTLGFVRLSPSTTFTTVKSPRGYPYSISISNPIRVADDWVVTSDGSIALVRGQDYHIDWIGVDGSASPSPKLPFVWHRLSDSEKVAIVDSVKALNAAHPGRAVVGANCATFGSGGANACTEGGADTVAIVNGLPAARRPGSFSCSDSDDHAGPSYGRRSGRSPRRMRQCLGTQTRLDRNT
jgi:hypothetical protein